MTERALTDFEQILLGSIAAIPRSAYDLKRHFSATPASVYQPSPGALVPALHRLERRGLLRVETDSSSGRRVRRVYHLTRPGRAAHQAWIRQPVAPGSVGRDLGLHLMRFVMMERELTRSEVLAFLTELANALDEFVTSMERYVASESHPGRHPRLALEHGIAVHRASLEWARSAMNALRDQAPGAG